LKGVTSEISIDFSIITGDLAIRQTTA